jgi:pyruvate dehydrogenase E1 component beta subunit
VRKTGRLVVVHEGWATYGISAEVVACVAEAPGVVLRAPPVRVGTEDTHLPASIILSRTVLPNSARVNAAIAKCIGGEDLPHPARV